VIATHGNGNGVGILKWGDQRDLNPRPSESQSDFTVFPLQEKPERFRNNRANSRSFPRFQRHALHASECRYTGTSVTRVSP